MVRSPYPGLRPFEREESDIFFGRETHVDALVDRLAGHRLLAVIGASGSGKSSLVRAGLLEALDIGLLAEAGSAWRIADLRPRDHPMTELAAALLHALRPARYEGDIALRRAALERGPLSLVEELRERPLPEHINLLILVDQFEELFRYQGLTGREEAEAFVALLLASVGQRQVPIYVVVTMRSDYFGECAQFEDLAEAVSETLYLCPRLKRDQIIAAIEGPAAVYGGGVEPRLVARIINDMGNDPDQLPLMQHALMRLWEGAQARDPAAPTLRLDDYLAADGIKGSLSRHADEILAEVTREAPERRDIARRLFCLVTEGDGESATRRLAAVAEVMAVAEKPLEEIARVADPFRAPGRSLLTPPLDRPLTPDTILDISHESLIRQWQILKDWVAEEAASVEQYRELERRVRQWTTRGARLSDPRDLDAALVWRRQERPNAAWASRYGGNLDATLRFLELSRGRRARSKWSVFAGLLLFILAMTLDLLGKGTTNFSSDEWLAMIVICAAASLFYMSIGSSFIASKYLSGALFLFFLFCTGLISYGARRFDLSTVVGIAWLVAIDACFVYAFVQLRRLIGARRSSLLVRWRSFLASRHHPSNRAWRRLQAAGVETGTTAARGGAGGRRQRALPGREWQ